jgi:hypothetical protein
MMGIGCEGGVISEAGASALDDPFLQRGEECTMKTCLATHVAAFVLNRSAGLSHWLFEAVRTSSRSVARHLQVRRDESLGVEAIGARGIGRSSVVAFAALAAACGLAFGQQCGGQIDNGQFDYPVPSQGSGNGWTASYIDAAGGWVLEGGSHGGIYRLNSGGQQDSDPCIGTLVTNLCPGVRYRISGEYESYYVSRQLPNAFCCYLDDVSVVSAPSGRIGVWMPWEFDFTAASSTARLRICGECNGIDDDFAVDSIRIEMSRHIQILRQPTDATVGVDGPVVFVVEAIPPCTQPLSFQWQRRVPTVPDESAPGAWVDLTDEGVIMNSHTGALTITRPVPGLATGFRCRITSACPVDAVYSQTVNFSVACPADFNADGGIDFADVEAFFERWENGC